MTYSSGLGPLLGQTRVGVESKCRDAGLLVGRDNVALDVLGAGSSTGAARGLRSTRLPETVCVLRTSHGGDQHFALRGQQLGFS